MATSGRPGRGTVADGPTRGASRVAADTSGGLPGGGWMDLDAAFGGLPGLTPREAQQRMAVAVAEALEGGAPLLVHAYGTTFALAMGRGNYACLARMDALVAATRLAATAQEEAALELVAWAVESTTGSRLDAPPGTRDDAWDLVATSGEDCPGQKGCAFHRQCFAERAREAAREVDVVVTNHHLLLLELELRQLSDAPGVMLPESDVIVVDEAHRLAAHAADLYGVTLTAARVGRAGAAADAAAKAVGRPSDWARRLRAVWEDQAGGLRPGPVAPGSRAAADEDAGGGRELAVWVEEGRGGGRTVRSALVEPGPVLAELLWGRVPAAVACSATLAVAGSLATAERALGVAGARGLVTPSPFDFRRNARLYVPVR